MFESCIKFLHDSNILTRLRIMNQIYLAICICFGQYMEKEKTDNWINGLEPAISILSTSLPRGSVPKKWEEEGVVGWGNISISKPTIGS